MRSIRRRRPYAVAEASNLLFSVQDVFRQGAHALSSLPMRRPSRDSYGRRPPEPESRLAPHAPATARQNALVSGPRQPDLINTAKRPPCDTPHADSLLRNSFGERTLKVSLVERSAIASRYQLGSHSVFQFGSLLRHPSRQRFMWKDTTRSQRCIIILPSALSTIALCRGSFAQCPGVRIAKAARSAATTQRMRPRSAQSGRIANTAPIAVIASCK
jgi:hypothetical protein